MTTTTKMIIMTMMQGPELRAKKYVGDDVILN